MNASVPCIVARLSVALFAGAFVQVSPAAEWDRSKIPRWGEELTRSGAEVPDAVIDPPDIKRFASSFRSGNHFETYAVARSRLLVNSLIPATSRELFRAIVGEPPSYWENEVPSRHNIGLGIGPGMKNLHIIVDWRHGVLVDIVANGERRTEPLSLETALSHLRMLLRAAGHDPDEFRLGARRFGEGTIILTSERINPLVIPAGDPTRYLMNAWMVQPRIDPLDARAVASIVANEVGAGDRQGRLAAARTFLHLLDPIAVKIDSVRDIPSHNRSPLDTDIRSAVRAPFERIDRQRNSVVVVFYAYRHVEGVVTRNRLEFVEGRLSQADVQVVGRMVGKPTIYF